MPPDLARWLERVDRDDPGLIYFASEIKELTDHGLQPHHAAVLVLRVTAQKQVERVPNPYPNASERPLKAKRSNGSQPSEQSHFSPSRATPRRRPPAHRPTPQTLAATA